MRCKVTVDTSHYPKEGLPIGWVISDLDSLCTTINGLWKGEKEPLVKVGVIRNANFTKDFTLDYSKIEYIDVELSSFEKRNLENGDIIVEKSGGSDNYPVGRSILYQGENGIYSFSNFTMSLRIVDKQALLPKYLYYVLQQKYRQGDMKHMQTQTTGLHNLLSEIYLSMPIPIPPREEQDRIVDSIDSLLNVVSEIECTQIKCAKEIESAKAKVLDLAIHGKLVPQNSSDEPAIELLKRINPNFVPSDNLHYDEALPSGWAITPLYTICDTINGLWKGKKEPLINVGVIRNANFTKDFTLDYSKIEYIDVEQKSFEKRNLENGDIIVEKSGGSDNFPVGRSILYRGENGKYSFSNFTMSLRIAKKDCILPEYLYYVLQYRYRRGDMKQLQTQTTGLHNLLTDIFMSLTIPIPPVEEQLRIVQTIKNLFGIINGIRDLFNDNKQGINSL